MNDTVLSVKTNSEVKKKAQIIADDLGFSLSSLINAYLKQLVRTQRVAFTMHEEPSAHFIDTIKKSKADSKAGRVSPAFTDAENALDWLNSASA